MVFELGALQAVPEWDTPITEPWGVSGARQVPGDWLTPIITADTMRAIASERKSTARPGSRPR